MPDRNEHGDLNLESLDAYLTWASSLNETELLQREDYMTSVFRACSKGRLRDLQIRLPIDGDPTFKFSLVDSMLASGLSCQVLTLGNLSWDFAGGMIWFMGPDLCSLRWETAPSFSQLADSPRGGLPYAPFLTTLDVDLNDKALQIVINFLQIQGPQIRKLYLRDDFCEVDVPMWDGAVTHLDLNLSSLCHFSYESLPCVVYTAVLKAAPNLERIVLSHMEHFQGSLLDDIPVNIRRVEMNDMRVEQDPPDVLISRLAQFNNLDRLPRMQYVYSNVMIEQTSFFKPALAAAKTELLAHFSQLGMLYTNQEEAEFLDLDEAFMNEVE